jgi:predicted transcriptional regulator
MSYTAIMKGRLQTAAGDRIVNFAEYTAPAKYKPILEDLAYRTDKSKHWHFRNALREYCEKYNVEHFIKMDREEIAKLEADITEKQALLQEKQEENREHCRAAVKRFLSEYMYNNIKITGFHKEQLAADLAKRYEQNSAEVLDMVEQEHIYFIEKYGDDPRSIYIR